MSAFGSFVANSTPYSIGGSYPLQIHKIDLAAQKAQTDEILLPISVTTVLGETDGKTNLVIASCPGDFYGYPEDKFSNFGEIECKAPDPRLGLKPKECQNEVCVAMYSLKPGCKDNYRSGCWEESMIFTPKQAYEVSQ